jgi:hypothetical protein
MAKKGLIGQVKCPYHHVCGNEQAEVRRDKNGNLYIVCYECEPVSQHFTLGAAQRVKALGLEAFVEQPAPPALSPKPASGDPPKPEPAKKRGVFDDLKL